MNGSRRPDTGFTLVELMIALVLSGVIAGAVIAALATSLNVANTTTKLVADSTDAGLISTFLYRDAQAAGATDPSTAQPDANVGVSTSATTAGWSDCVQPGSSLVVRFSWFDAITASSRHRNVVTYALDSQHHLTRRFCAEGAPPADLVLGQAIASATAVCAPDPACGAATSSVALALTGTAAQSPFKYTLKASLRTDEQGQATLANSSAVPLLALGAPEGTSPCPTLTVTGSRQVTVLGDVVAGSNCDASPIKVTGSLLQQTGERRSFPDVADPFHNTVPPATSCGSGANPNPIGDGSDPSTAVLYPNAVSITGAVVFKPGRYIFCDGLTFGGSATISGSGVFLFVAGGSFDVAATATVNLSAATTGPYANLLVWVATSQHISLDTGPIAGTYRGYIYAPTSQIDVAGGGANNVGGIIARGVKFDGSTRSRIGLPIPELANTPKAFPTGQKGVAYPPTTLTATGGTAPYTWVATPLPDGITLDPVTGMLSGTPSGPAASTTTVVVTTFDATSTAHSATFTIDLVASLGVAAAPAALPAGQVGLTYPSTTIAATGGTAPFRFAATGLPTGLTIDPATGVISGSPTAAGQFSAVVTITDGRSATVTRTYPFTVRSVLGITALVLPAGQVDVGYPPTPITPTGGLAPYTWSATGLPPGLAIDVASGVISGTPKSAGAYSVVVTATDAALATATTTSSVTITAPLGVGTTALPGGQVGVDYPPTALLPAGGTAPYTWSATGLPAGLMLDPATGVLSGSPTTAGAFTVTATVVDGAATQSAATYTVTIVPVLTISTPSSLPAGQVGLGYPSTTIGLSGGTAPFRWAATGLPAGLTIDPASGVMTGSPTVAGAFTIGVTVTDALAATNARIYPLTIRSALAITSPTLPAGTVGVAYSTASFTASGGLAPYAWAASGLPAGLTMNPTTGAIAGTPTNAGTSSVVVTVTDSASARATSSSPITVASSVPAGCPANATGWRGEYFTNTSLAGTPSLCRDDPAIDFDWGYIGPAWFFFPIDNFSARWTRTQTFAAGTYTFTMGTNDGGRLYVDGDLVLDRWQDQSYSSPAPTVVRDITAGAHTIVMEYFERTGLAAATLDWTIAPTSMCPADVDGWKAEYFSNISLTGPPQLCGDDAAIDFNWGYGSPGAPIPVDNFSVRWTRTETFSAGYRTFELGTDDGGRLYIDGVLVIDEWNDQSYPSPAPSVKIKVGKGEHTIVVEYYERGGVARATLDW